jgi:hypothetical protein
LRVVSFGLVSFLACCFSAYFFSDLLLLPVVSFLGFIQNETRWALDSWGLVGDGLFGGDMD